MSEDRPTLAARELVAHAVWLRRMAAALVGEQSAEDVVQQTYVAALESPPAGGRPIGPWLARVLRNFARMAWRRQVRRQRNEHAAVGRMAPLPTAEELLANHQAQRLIADAVEALDEPYRSTVLLCYAEGLSPSEVAARQGILAGTVRWRLKRALDVVRQRLDECHGGDRRAWSALVAPLARGVDVRPTPAAGSAASTATAATTVARTMATTTSATAMIATRTQSGASAMKPILIATTVIVLAGAAALVAREHAPSTHWARAHAAPFASTSARHAAAPAGLPRFALGSSPSSGRADGSITGVVRDHEGRAMSGVLVAAAPKLSGSDIGMGRRPLGPAGIALTDGNGRYAMTAIPAGMYGVTVSAAGFVPTWRADVILHDGSAAARVDFTLEGGGFVLRGHVVDSGGGPVAGARIGLLRMQRDLAKLDFTQLQVAVADAKGAYALSVTSGTYGVGADADGYAQARLHVRIVDRDRTQDIALEPAAQVSGKVIDARTAQPVPGAIVRLGRLAPDDVPYIQSATTDARGAFVFANVVPASFRLWAQKGRAAGRGSTSVAKAERVSDVVVPLADARTVSGRVLSANGEPVGGAEVWFVAQDGVNLQEAQATSRADGTYRIDGVLTGDYRIAARLVRTGRDGAKASIVSTQIPITVAAADIGGVDLALALRDGKPIDR